MARVLLTRKTLTLLIDADIVTYAHARSGQRAYAFDEEEEAVALDRLEDVEEGAVHEIEELKRKFGTESVILCFTDTDGNFRKKVLPTYKLGRPPKPRHYHPLRECLTAKYRTYLKPHLEGDDVMGILATSPRLVPGKKIIVSIDKDMRQIPGTLYNPGKGTTSVITAEEGLNFHFEQMLTGDPTDNYKGCPGVGPKKARDILTPAIGAWHSPLGAWQQVVMAYERKGLTAWDAVVQARVSKILQWTDYDYRRKAPKLWNPPT